MNVHLLNSQFLKKTMGWIGRLVCICSILYFSSPVFANPVSPNGIPLKAALLQDISGVVIDANGEPIPGVNVLVKDTQIGTQTDAKGEFTLNTEQGAVLVFSFVGFQVKEVTVTSESTIRVTLQEENNNLEEVVVVGYGVQKKINVTGSVASIKTDNTIRSPITNVKSMLIGQTSGIITNQNPGLPGQDNVSLSIRGFGNPLVIVDGVESFLDRIDPNDIENISILKDGSAAIYGVRGGDGVILITTKRGKSGKTRIDYHGFVGTQRPVRFLEPVNAVDYIQAKRNGIFNVQYDPANPGKEIPYGEWTTDLIDQYNSGQLASHNWVDALLRNTGGKIVSNNVSVSGGSDKVRFYSSVGNVTQNSIFAGDFKYNKLTLTNNLDAKLTDNLSFILTSSYINEKQDYPLADIGTVWNDLRTALPFFSPSLPDPDRAPYSGFTERSPVARTQKKFGGYDYTNLQTFAVAGELMYKVPAVSGLTAGAKANVRMRNIYEERLSKTYGVFRYDETDGTYAEVTKINRLPSFRKGYTSSGNDPRLRVLSRFYLNYDKSLTNHKIGALAFIEREDNEVNSLTVTRRELLSDDVPTIVAGDDALTTSGGNGLPIEYSRVSLASRLNYSYKDKYLFEATLRADASSKFSPEVRWGYFPSVSLGWNIAQENFMSNTSFSELKLRTSFSQTGRDNVVSNTAFDYLTGFEELGSVYYLDGTPITQIVTTGLVNQFLTWEKVTLYNVGLDFSLMRNKLYGNVDAFYRLRDGIFGPAVEDVPSTFGANLPLVNINSSTIRGFEFLVGYRNQIGDFKYDLSSNFTLTREKYKSWQENIDVTDPNQVRIDQRTGNYVNRLFGYVSDGLINSTAELESYIGSLSFETLNGQPQVGDIRYVDVSGPDGTPDGVINRYDIQQIGFGEQPDITFGLNSQLSYKNLSLLMIWQGASMFNVVASGNIFRHPFDNEAVPLTLHSKYSWTQDPANPGVGNNADAQLPAYNGDGGRVWNNNMSDFWVRNGTYLRFKTATVSYRFNAAKLKSMKINNAEIYFSGDNLFTLDNLGIYSSVIDPEQAYNNAGYSIPLLRSYTAGVRLGL